MTPLPVHLAGALLTSVLAVAPAGAQQPLAEPAPPAASLAAPRDVPYPGVIALTVDATDIARGIFRAHQTLPVRAGPLTLYYPKWIPGAHSAAGLIDRVAGLSMAAGSRRLAWRRDALDVYAFHVDVPPGARTLDVDFQFLSAVNARDGRVAMTSEILSLQWNTVVFHPLGHYSRRIIVQPSVRLPAEWAFATALEPASEAAGLVTFKPVTLETLVDSPLMAGLHTRRVDLDPSSTAPVHLDLFADKPESLVSTAAQDAAHRALIQQAYKLFGSRHFDHYDFLLALSDKLGGIDLEHHQSNENVLDPGYFTAWDETAPRRYLTAHEFVHSWNGKFRRPADLWTPDFASPMRNSLLWVYEGLTSYYDHVLSARSGLLTPQQVLEEFTALGAGIDLRNGRAWRPLADTVYDPQMGRRSAPWRSWQRAAQDYYVEGAMVWLDIDTKIRELSADTRSLDDFARRFFGVYDGSHAPATYTFEDVVAGLNAVQPYDWRGFLRARLDGHGPGAPLDGFVRGGYEIVFTDAPSTYGRLAETATGSADLRFSLGLSVDRAGNVTDMLWDSPAFGAGLTVGSQIVEVDGSAFSIDRLKAAVTAAKSGLGGVRLKVKHPGDAPRGVEIAYRGGLRFPHPQRLETGPHRLDAVLAPLP